MFRGDDQDFTLTFTKLNGTVQEAQDITGWTIWFTAKLEESDTDASAKFQKSTAASAGIVLTDPTGGIATLSIAEADTSDLRNETILYYDVQVKDGADKIVTTEKGTLTVQVDITRTTTTS
jgi:hypothetical protein